MIPTIPMRNLGEMKCLLVPGWSHSIKWPGWLGMFGSCEHRSATPSIPVQRSNGPTLLGQCFESFQVGLRSGAGDPVGPFAPLKFSIGFLLHLFVICDTTACYFLIVIPSSCILRPFPILPHPSPSFPKIWTWYIHQHIAAPTFILSHSPWQAMAGQKAWIQPACATSVLRNLDATGALLALDEMWKLQAVDGGRPWYTSGLLSKEIRLLVGKWILYDLIRDMVWRG